MLKIEFRLDQDSAGNYGYWNCPECDSTFFGGGDAIHGIDCPRSGYGGLIYYYTPAELSAWKEKLPKHGYVVHLPFSPDALSDHFLKEAIINGDVSIQEIRSITENYVTSTNPSRLSGIMANLEKLILSQE